MSRALAAVAAVLVFGSAVPAQAQPQPGDLDRALQAADRGDVAAAEPVLRPLAEAGDARATYGLGRAHLLSAQCAGYGAACQAKVVPLITRAAELGEPRAADLLGLWHQHGSLGRAKDMALAVRWRRVAGEGGDLSALLELGFICSRPDVQACGGPDAVAAYEKAAAAGNAFAPFRLGEMHSRGERIAADPVKAAAWYAVAAARDWGDAQAALGQAHLDGVGAPRDPERARELFQRAAGHGKAAGFYGLARLAKESAPADRQALLTLLRDAVNASESTSRTGDDYREAKAGAFRMAASVCGVGAGGARMIHQAARYGDAAARAITLEHAEAGDADAQHVMAQLAMWDMPDDKDAAFRWSSRAAAQGHVEAMFRLSNDHALGWGTPADPAAAYLWLLIARPRAEGVLRRWIDDDLFTAEKKLGVEQRAAARAAAKAWRPVPEAAAPATPAGGPCLVPRRGRPGWTIAGR